MKIPKRVELTPIADEAIIASAFEYAQAMLAAGEGLVAQTPSEVPEVGAKFAIDLLIPEGIETGDSREFEYGAIDSRLFPLPLYWQILTDEGHRASAIVGRIDYAERLDADPLPEDADPELATPIARGWGNAYGVFDVGPFGREAERLVRNKMLRGVSADLDKFEATMALAVEDEEEDDGVVKNDKMNIRQARLMGATLLGKPAFQECIIRLVDDEAPLDEIPLEDGMYEDAIDDPDYLEASLVASAAPIVPPREWFKNPALKTLTPLTVADDGKVFGHIASWQMDHLNGSRRRPPHSRSNYAYFRTGVLRTDDGSDVPVGQLTLAGGHADVTLSAADAISHYDDTNSAVADVTVGEDAFGIWVSGSLRPDVTPSQVRAFRASAPSGDWRPINNTLELVACCAVNVPGFPVARAMVAGGQVMALVAAGSAPILELKKSETQELSDRLAILERVEFEKQKAAALTALSPLKEQHDAALVASAEAAERTITALKEVRDAELSAQADQARKLIFGE